MKKFLCALCAAVLLMNAGCSSTTAQSSSPSPSSPSSHPPISEPSPSQPEPVELLVSAAASLSDCMDELKTLYESANRGVTITCNYGASGALQQQIEQGAPVDLFVSAGQRQMTALVDADLMLEDTVQVLLQNELVLIVPKDAGTYDSFTQLANPAVERIGVGEPESVPVGQYTAQVFNHLDIADAVQPRLVFAKDVREVLSWVETGNVTAGVVYATDAALSEKVTVCCTAPDDSHEKVHYPIGVTKDTPHPDAAKAFLEFLKSDAADTICEKYGFIKVV